MVNYLWSLWREICSMKRWEARLMTQKKYRPSSQKVEEETRIENKKVMTSSRGGPSPKIKSNVSIMENRGIWKEIVDFGKGNIIGKTKWKTKSLIGNS